jgi:EmrB/QacA subfamily drug resistance transporter
MTGAAPTAPGAAPDRVPSRLLVALALACALAPLNSTMIAVALPAIGGELSADIAALTQWLVTSYLLVAIVAQSPAGKLGDLFGHGRMLYAGQLVLALGAATGLLANSVEALAGARVLMAAGGAVMVPSAMAMVRSRLPEHRRGHVFGAFAAVMALAAGIGPTLAGELVARFGWRAIFLAGAMPLVLVAVLAAGATRGEAQPAARPTFDRTGTLLLGVGLTVGVLGIEIHRAIGAALGALGLVVLVGFVRWERRARDPVIDLGLLRCRPYLAGSSVIALQNLAFYGLLFQLPFFFAQAFGAGSIDTGRSLLPLMVMVVVVSPASGWIVQRIGPRRTVLVGAFAGVASVCWLALGRVATLGAALPPLAVLGIGLGLSSAPSQAAAMNAIGAHQSGMAAGLMTTLRYLGGVLGIAILGLVLGSGVDATLSRHRTAMAIFAASFALSVLASLGLPRRRQTINESR